MRWGRSEEINARSRRQLACYSCHSGGRHIYSTLEHSPWLGQGLHGRKEGQVMREEPGEDLRADCEHLNIAKMFGLDFSLGLGEVFCPRIIFQVFLCMMTPGS